MDMSVPRVLQPSAVLLCCWLDQQQGLVPPKNIVKAPKNAYLTTKGKLWSLFVSSE